MGHKQGVDGGLAKGRGCQSAVSGSRLGSGRHQHTDTQALLHRRTSERNLQPARTRGLHGRTWRAAAHSLPSGLDAHTNVLDLLYYLCVDVCEVFDAVQWQLD